MNGDLDRIDLQKTGVSGSAGSADRERPRRGVAGSWEVMAQAGSSELKAEFPQVTTWYGSVTATWWALVPLTEGARLVEALNPRELRAAIVNAGAWPWPRR